MMKSENKSIRGTIKVIVTLFLAACVMSRDILKGSGWYWYLGYPVSVVLFFIVLKLSYDAGVIREKKLKRG